MKPANYPPPVRPGEFVGSPCDDPDSQIETGVVFVGAGPAGLAGAIRLAQLVRGAPAVAEALGEMGIVVVEKGRCPGAHLLSGAVINPVAFGHLFPETPVRDLPFFGPVEREAVHVLTSGSSFRIPTPPSMCNRGNYVASLSMVGRWLGERAEELGVTILSETSASGLLVADGRVRGIKVQDKGLDREGKPLGNHEPGPDLLARITVLGDGTFGHLTQAALEHFGVARPAPQIFSLGVKEVWEVKRPLDHVVHTMGWPLRPWARWREFGGSFCYPMGDSKVSIGLVVGLDYADASLSVHDLFQDMKRHPIFREILEGGSRVERGWGAKTIPEGGFHSLPERLSVPGALFVGDAAGFVNVPSLKGIHYAMWSGILAAEAIFARLTRDLDGASKTAIDEYDAAVRRSFIHDDLYAVRNVRQVFRHGFFVGGALAGLMTMTGGRFPAGCLAHEADAEVDLVDGQRPCAKCDGAFTFDKLSSVHAAGNRSRDNQPNHIRVLENVDPVIGKSLIRLCPASVYEWDDETNPTRLVVNATNCIHCGAINAKGGRLTPPEGGSGPEYTLM